jgi:NAD(P)-dependent dehydrogenase (short-subunit alcohol dehydrogenase family)
MKDLKDKIVLITGGASGIGQATALRFAREGAHIVLADVNEKGLKDTAEQIEALGRKALPLRTDVSRREEVEEMSRKALEEFGRVDILMNNAAVALFAEIKDTGLSDWEWIMNINLWGSIYPLHYLLPQMVERKSGHIINVASWAGILGTPSCGAYTTAKYGLVGMSEVLRAELRRFGIGVTAVCPGIVKTNIMDAAKMKGYREEFREKAKMLGNTPERVAKKIVRAVKKNRALVLTDFAIFAYNAKRLSPALGRLITLMWLKLSHQAKDKTQGS